MGGDKREAGKGEALLISEDGGESEDVIGMWTMPWGPLCDILKECGFQTFDRVSKKKEEERWSQEGY